MSRKMKLIIYKDFRNTGRVKFSTSQKKFLIFKHIYFGFKVIKTCNPYPLRKIHTEKEMHSTKETELVHPKNSE